MESEGYDYIGGHKDSVDHHTYERIAGKASAGARNVMVELLRDSDELIGDPKSVTHPVKFFEKGDKPLKKS